LEQSVSGDRNRGRERVRLVQHVLGHDLFPSQAAALRREYRDHRVERLTQTSGGPSDSNRLFSVAAPAQEGSVT
jgi:hypothetical protein